MAPAITPAAPRGPSANGHNAAPERWLVVATAIALWFIPINQLRVEWSINPQYAYGWAVPLLALYLFMERWKCRPAPRPAHSVWAIAAVAAMAALILLPARLVEEAAPDWRMVSWVLALASVSISLAAISYAGGRPWLRHFIFPVCFLLVAVPWPMPFEQAVVQRLMRYVASLCVEALGWWGIPSVQQGNVIQIASGSVGVEEACSGVRSLQTTLMIALFLGDLFRFIPWRRIVLLGAGLALAFVCNAGRAFILVYLYASKGQESLAQYHDRVGMGVLLVSLAGLAALAWLLGRKSAPRAEPEASSPPPGRSIPRLALILILVWLALIEVGTEGWYRIRGMEDGKPIAWTIDFPTQQPGYRDLPISEVTQAILRYNEGRSGIWLDFEGNQWSMFFLRWFPGRASVQLARSHGPEVCLPAAGMTMRSDLGVSSWQVGAATLDAHSYIFSYRDRLVYVFFCLAEDRRADDGPASTRRRMTPMGRLEDVWNGRRNRGQQVLEITVTGPADAGQARAMISGMLDAVLRPSANLQGG